MGREIRIVPPNWDHPRYTEGDAPHRNRVGDYRPLHDQTFSDAAREWKNEFSEWERGARPDYLDDESKALEYWEYNGQPPERAYYRSYADDEASWFQVYETVSEGTPVTPPFATREELVDYLVKHGDFWQQKRWADGGRFMQPEPPGYSREAAEKFVMGDGYAPSMVTIRTPTGTTVATGLMSLRRDPQ